MGRACGAERPASVSTGRPARPFRYLDKGSFAVIGRGAAVGSIFPKFEVSGLIAWLMWATIHLLYLVGFRSRLAVVFTWTYSYLTWRARRAAHHLHPLADRAEPAGGASGLAREHRQCQRAERLGSRHL